MVRSRIAPTPSGYLHLGNAVNFVLTWLWVRKRQGVLRLRIDDLDSTRARPEYLDDIFYTLQWLGLNWEEGPQTVEEHQRLFSQNLRTERYNRLLNDLINTGMPFACNCSRKSLQHSTGMQYPGTCRNKNLPFNTPETALRILTPNPAIVTINDKAAGLLEVNLYHTMRDFVISRRDNIVAYQVASLADDIDYGINLVVRGQDLMESTAAQLYLEKLCGGNTFARCAFYHHPLVKDGQGIKLSKSAGSTAIKEWRNTDPAAQNFYGWISSLLKTPHPAQNSGDLLQQVPFIPLFQP